MKVKIDYTLDLNPEQVAVLKRHYEDNKAEGESFRDMIKWYFIADGQFQLDTRIENYKEQS